MNEKLGFKNVRFEKHNIELEYYVVSLYQIWIK